MSNGSAVTEKQPTYCKWCGRVEITFSDAFKSKSGKFIPIEKVNGVPHKCPANPNNQQQQQQQQSDASTKEADTGNTNALLKIIIAELQRLVKLFEEQQQK